MVSSTQKEKRGTTLTTGEKYSFNGIRRKSVKAPWKQKEVKGREAILERLGRGVGAELITFQ